MEKKYEYNYTPEFMPEMLQNYVDESGCVNFQQNLPNGAIPYMFREADRYLRAMGEIPMSYDESNQKIYTTSMQESLDKHFGTNPNIQGPHYVTQEYADEYYKNKKLEEKIEQIDYQKEMIKCITEKERLSKKLSSLSIKKKGDAKKISKINVEILELNKKLLKLEKASGISINSIRIERGNKVTSFFQTVKKTVTKVIKKTKKFIMKHAEPIFTGLALIGSLLMPNILKKIFPAFAS